MCESDTGVASIFLLLRQYFQNTADTPSCLLTFGEKVHQNEGNEDPRAPTLRRISALTLNAAATAVKAILLHKDWNTLVS